MKKVFFVGLILVFSTIVGFSQSSEKSFKVEKFDNIELGYAFEAHIHERPEYSVSVKGDSRDLPYIKVFLKGNTLVIKDARSGRIFRYMDRQKLVINIGMPELKEVEVMGAAHAEIYGFNKQDFMNIEASGASQVIADKISLNKLNVVATGASNVKILGTTFKANLVCSGASNFKGKGLTARDVDAEASGASSITLRVTDSLNALASGASNINYIGQPKNLDVVSHSASNIRRIEAEN